MENTCPEVFSMATPSEATAAGGRVRSIDALRGFDMFWLIGGQELVLILSALFIKPLHAVLKVQLDHAAWEGFTAEDLIMPLFLFLVGAAMPFSFARRIELGQSKPPCTCGVLRRCAGAVGSGHDCPRQSVGLRS